MAPTPPQSLSGVMPPRRQGRVLDQRLREPTFSSPTPLGTKLTPWCAR
jgi:hypothetical protein